jgi:raffinose/stachyose/melibiose transport system permease protein
MQKGERLEKSPTIQSYRMIAGSVLGLIIFVVIPLCWIMRWCLFSYKGYGSINFVGLKNFIRVFERSPKFWLAVQNTFVFAFGKLLVEIPLALVLAFILTKKLRGQTFYRSMFFMPSMVSVAVIGVVFTYLFSSYHGVVNELFGLKIKWFSSGTMAMLVLMFASIWQNFGINMLFFMTGLQSISPEMYEAAAIDGANNRRQFFEITIPLLGPVTQMVLMNAILGSLKVTDLVLTLTNGNPSGKTEVMMTSIYKAFFPPSGSSAMDYGYGSALTVITALILTIVTIVYLRTTKKSSEIY